MRYFDQFHGSSSGVVVLPLFITNLFASFVSKVQSQLRSRSMPGLSSGQNSCLDYILVTSKVGYRSDIMYYITVN